MSRKQKFQTLATLAGGVFFGTKASQFQIENLVATIAAGCLLIGIFGTLMSAKGKTDDKDNRL